ncbi:hypothetical protein B8A11_16515, partial [Staphylococcus aureus]
GFRVGFMTFGTFDQTTKEVLEAKVKGLIRSNISSGPLPTQSAVKRTGNIAFECKLVNAVNND